MYCVQFPYSCSYFTIISDMTAFRLISTDNYVKGNQHAFTIRSGNPLESHNSILYQISQIIYKEFHFMRFS